MNQQLLTRLNNFSGFWDVAAISSFLVLGPRMIRAEEYCLLEGRPNREVVQISSLDWLVCI